MINRETFALIFKEQLEKHNLTLSQFAARMTENGMKTSYQQAYRWRRGQSLPNALQFISLCQVLHLDHVPAYFSDQVKERLLQEQELSSIAPVISAADTYTSVSDNIYHLSDRRLPVILQKASAGLGQYVDEADMELIYVPEDVPAHADFGIHVSGDSMEPRYHSGDLVWVQKKNSLSSGEIGVFYLDGNIYIKRLCYDSDHAQLVSLSKKYQPIPITSESVFTVWGKVLS